MTEVDTSWAKGQRVGRYQVLSRLSVGGMAEVFLAVVSGPGGFRKFVTLKRILPSHRENEEFVRMFLDEARITAALSHANIGQVFDLGEESGELFVAMEFIPGLDLSRVFRARGKQLPLGFSCAVMRDICHALHFAHHYTDAAGAPYPVVHRDVSPKNVMVAYDGNVKVIDFGIAKARGKLEQTDVGVIKGSTNYMSPEQISGRELDGRSDLYSAGVILWELLCGRRLFDERSHTGVVRRMMPQAGQQIAAPHTVNPAVPQALSEVALRALASDPAERFSTGKQMASMIDAAAGAATFDADAIASFMRSSFHESVGKTQALLQGSSQDVSNLSSAAEALADSGSGSDSPRSPRPEEVSTRVLAEPAPAGQSTGPFTVMAVDDSRTGLLVLQADLTREGYQVIACKSASEALASLGAAVPDLIILDVQMPEMDGFELCRRIREHERLRPVPVIFLSVACSLEERVQGLQVGGDDFIRKPYEAEEFTARVRALLRRSAMGRR